MFFFKKGVAVSVDFYPHEGTTKEHGSCTIAPGSLCVRTSQKLIDAEFRQGLVAVLLMETPAFDFPLVM